MISRKLYLQIIGIISFSAKESDQCNQNKSQLIISPIVFDILKLKNPAFNPAHLKLHNQFVASIDMKLHAQNQLYTPISF